MYRILIVEDDYTIASNVAAHLERWDYETVLPQLSVFNIGNLINL